MPAIKLKLPFPEKVCFVGNASVLQKRKPAEGETPEQALTESFYLPCSVFDSTKYNSISTAMRNQQSEFDNQQLKTVWNGELLSLTVFTPPTKKVVENNPFTVKFMGFCFERTTTYVRVVLGEEAYTATIPLSEFTEAVRLGGIASNGDMGCKFVFHYERHGTGVRLIPIGSTLYLKLLKEQDKLLNLEEKNRYLSASEFVAGNVYLNEVTKTKWLCIGWYNGRVLYEEVDNIPDNRVDRFSETMGRYSRPIIETRRIHGAWVYDKAGKTNPPNVTKHLFGVGENVQQWRNIMRGFVEKLMVQETNKIPAARHAHQTQYRNYYGNRSHPTGLTDPEEILALKPKYMALANGLHSTKRAMHLALREQAAAELELQPK